MSVKKWAGANLAICITSDQPLIDSETGKSLSLVVCPLLSPQGPVESTRLRVIQMTLAKFRMSLKWTEVVGRWKRLKMRGISMYFIYVTNCLRINLTNSYRRKSPGTGEMIQWSRAYSS